MDNNAVQPAEFLRQIYTKDSYTDSDPSHRGERFGVDKEGVTKISNATPSSTTSMNMKAWVFQTPHLLQQPDHGPVLYVDFSSLFFLL